MPMTFNTEILRLKEHVQRILWCVNRERLTLNSGDLSTASVYTQIRHCLEEDFRQAYGVKERGCGL